MNEIERIRPRTATVGIFGVGHPVYWGQFEGLLERLMEYHGVFRKTVEGFGVKVVDYGMVDSDRKAFEVSRKAKSDGADLIFCNMLTYATSSVFAPVIREADVPVVLTALQPLSRLDYSRANTRMQLENDCICSVPEFTGVAARMGKQVADVVIGTLWDDPRAVAEIGEWCDIAKVLHDLRGARFGLMGHVLEAMYDMHADPTAVAATFGVHVPLLEVDDVLEVAETVTRGEIERKKREILDIFDTPEPVSDPLTEKLTEKDLEESAKTAVALEKFVEKFDLSGLAYHYNGRSDSPHRNIVSSFVVGNSILNAKGVPMCGEYDIKTLIAMFIMDRLGTGGSFAEFHPFDFDGNIILVGHDGPHHIAVAEGRPVVRSLKKYHGKPGSGASVEFKLKEGPITVFGITQTPKGFKFVVAEGESQAGPIPPTGNTNTRGYFPPDTREFVKRWVMEGPTHHFALGVGHRAGTIKKIAQVLGVECAEVR
ncbi:MAG: L-fucose/L-arabinose isomerase family protein [Clostridia bacterium]|nr:L-fucose/L-arabinose isomerase family protein [Clostridia bacterium]